MATENTLLDALALTTPDQFHAFPYEKPYDIQLDLMRHLYASIESRSLAMYLPASLLVVVCIEF